MTLTLLHALETHLVGILFALQHKLLLYTGDWHGCQNLGTAQYVLNQVSSMKVICFSILCATSYLVPQLDSITS